MQYQDEDLDSYPLELAETRPTMIKIPWLGEIPIEIGALIFGASMLMFVIIGWKFSLWAPAAWYLVGYLITKNYHAVTQSQKYLKTSAWCLDSKTHGGASLTPFPQIPNRVRGMI